MPEQLIAASTRCVVLNLSGMLLNGYMSGFYSGIGQTKADDTRREITLNHLVHEALENQRSVTEGFSDCMFCMASGNSFINRNITSRVWYPTLCHPGPLPRRAHQTPSLVYQARLVGMCTTQARCTHTHRPNNSKKRIQFG